MESKFPLVSIGMPVYNGEQYLRKAVESILSQNYQSFELVISDNASSDNTEEIIKEYRETDGRIRYYRNKENIGIVLNFKKVFNLSKGNYFMWASHDDIWDKKFVETGMKALLKYSNYDAWFCTIRNIDSFGRVIREYPGFSRFTSTNPKAWGIIKYLLDPEVMGKANIIHSIYKKDALKKVLQGYQFYAWGGDMSFNLVFQSRYNLIATDQVLMSKRIIRSSDRKEKVDPIIINHPNRHIFPFNKSIEYIFKYYNDLKNTPYKYLVIIVMALRIPIALRNDYLTKEYYQKVKDQIKRKCLGLKSYIAKILESVLPREATEQYYKRKIKILKKKKQKEIYEIYQMASLYEKLENYEISRRLFREIIKTSKDNNLMGGAYFHIGALEMISGKREESRNYFEASLEKIPEHKKAKKYLEILNA